MDWINGNGWNILLLYRCIYYRRVLAVRNITLNTGKNVIINENSLSDMMETVRTELSFELADSLEEMISDKFFDLEEERKELNQEMRSYESNLEDAERSLQDIEEDTENLLNYITESKRIDRKRLIERLREIRLRAKENL